VVSFPCSFSSNPGPTHECAPWFLVNSDLAITIARKIIHDYLVATIREPDHTGIIKCDFCRPISPLQRQELH